MLARKMQRGEPSDRFQKVHRAMAEAARTGGSKRLTLLEGCSVEQLTARETYWWEALRPALNAVKPGVAGFKEMKRTPNRDKWFDAFLNAEDWTALKRGSPSGAYLDRPRGKYLWHAFDEKDQGHANL